MLTVNFRRLGLQSGDRVLDVGCGAGRHAFEAHRQGAHTVAYDRNGGEVKDAAAMLGAMRLAGEAPAGVLGTAVNGDALALPFADGTFDRVIAAEVLEHVPADAAAMAELVRVLRPGGTLAVTVPSWFPEKVCWALAGAVKRVIDDPVFAAALGQKGRDRVLAMYTWPSVARQTAQWYRDYLGETVPRPFQED
jgi:ubiquinone/menaquinone biosynthesis C-methylase UbiE